MMQYLGTVLLLLFLAVAFVVALIGGATLIATPIVWLVYGSWDNQRAAVEVKVENFTLECINQGFTRQQCLWLEESYRPKMR